MSDQTIQEQVKHIKQSFRLLMNGVTAQSMREKGVAYHLNWGVSLPHLHEMATEYKPNYDLAIALWKEDIRECKILATLLMPQGQMDKEVAEVWMEQIHSLELAEICALNVFQHLHDAPMLAFSWIALDKELYEVCGYHVLGRLFGKGQEPNERGINEYLDQVSVALQDNSLAVRHAAMNSLNRFCELGEEYDQMARKALRDLDVF